MSDGAVGNMAELGITESFMVKRQVLLSASEAAEMILRVDNIIKSAPRSVSACSGYVLLAACCNVRLSVCRKRVPDHHPC